jgi:hypothetical protein
MAHSISQAYTKEKTDELYTPKILVDIILPYLNRFIKKYYTNQPNIVLCPFDTENSEFVLRIKEYFGKNLAVEYSHIDIGKDFFTYTKEEVKKYCAIVSNPPFSKKLAVFKKLDELGLPYMMLTNIMCLNYQEIGNYFADNPTLQLLIPDKRVSFDSNPSSFNSAYFCKKVLPKDLIFTHIENNNANQYFIPSRMYKNFK